MTETSQQYGALTADVRAELGKGPARRARQRGLVPGVLYGGQGSSVALTVDPQALSAALDPRLQYNTLLLLSVRRDDGEVHAAESCMIADYQIDPIRDELVHVDFVRIDPDEEVVRLVPVQFTGRAAGTVEGGVLRTYVREVKVRAKPSDVPAALVVDVTALQTNDSLQVRDVTIDSGRLLEKPERMLAFVARPKVEEEVAPTEEEEAAAGEGEESGDRAEGEGAGSDASSSPPK
jgi:large subunit ribosomal protein L25